jgi:pyridoxamine 5'-phosphate oxidase
MPDLRLAAGLDRAWALLATAVVDRAAGLRLPVVATVSGGDPDARIMVLRAVDHDAGTIAFHSDRRAAKVAMVAAEPRVAVTGYDGAARVQLRLHGTATVSAGGAAVDVAWAGLPESARDTYRRAAAPGTPVAVPPELPVVTPADGGRDRFAVVTVTLDRIEWLDLAVPGHRRAVHRRVDGWRGAWLVP